MIRKAADLSVSAHAGMWIGHFGGASGSLFGMWQSVTLPSGIPAYLHFYSRVQSNEPCAFLPDHVTIEINSTQIADQPVCAGFNSADWLGASYDLSAYAGQTIEIRFSGIRYSTTGDNNLYIDDVSLQEIP